MWATEILADFIYNFRPEDIPAAAREMTKHCILDVLGAAAAGYTTRSATAMRSLGASIFSEGKAGVWFSNKRLNQAASAMANSAAASALDVDDGHRAAGGHPGASIIPAAFAAAQSTGADAEEVIAAIALGYEIAVRVSAARDLASLDTFSTGRWCSYGAAAAAGYLKKLKPEPLAEALSIAGVKSPGLSASGYSTVMGNSVKEGIPWSTLTGLASLELAEQGFTGPTDILDHQGYFSREKILEGLGKDEFAVEKVYFKPYSCCRWIHSAIDALLMLMSRHGIACGDMERVSVYTFERALRLNNYADPDSLEGAQYSIPFSLAVAALRGGGALLPMTRDCLKEPEIVALAGKVELHVDPELDRAFPAKVPARVTLKTCKSEYEEVVHDPLGDPANPLDLQGLEAKFRKLTGKLLQKGEQDETIEAVREFERGGMSRLLESLSGHARL